MKRAYSFLTILILLCGLSILFSCKQTKNGSASQSKIQETKSFSAEITMKNEKVKKIDNLERVFVSHATFSQIRTDVPTRIDIVRYNIPVGNGIYGVAVPFEIIKSVTFEEKEEINSYTEATVTLGNNIIVKGSSWGVFKGKTDLGKTEINMENIKEIVFKQPPGEKYSDPSFGDYQAKLYTIDNQVKELSGAALAKELVNENGCYLDAYEQTDILTYQIEDEATYEISWEEIDAIVHDNPRIRISVGGYYEDPFRLITKDGKNLTVTCPPWLSVPQNVRGLMDFGNEYKLLATVTLYDRSFKKLEFR
ncbi:MAG: hypothetical protein JXR46_06525 [Calditrichaceae bacterium]|nr:hypothetical protein [Calditrichaceae bacterium]MBN2708683.1 hypothetical protein [Calditrichaceae bacterium]RQV92796.1 MAG: hypothetical protein EH224_14215 [Calditrichota bacterium]